MTTASADVRDEVVDVCDGRLHLHVKVAGEGPPVVFFHPLPGLEWQPFLDRLAEHHTVYAPEHPGTSPGEPGRGSTASRMGSASATTTGTWRAMASSTTSGRSILA